MDIPSLEEAVCKYFAKGLTQSTQQTYRSGKNRYLKFCADRRITPTPVIEPVLTSFVAHLAVQGLKSRSIKVYLSAVRHLQIESGFPDPFLSHMPRLEYVLKGVKREEAERGSSGRTRLPITPSILRKLKDVWEPRAEDWDTRMIWAACCLCFFAFLRISELTVPADSQYDPKIHLSPGDIAFDRRTRPTLIRVSIKKSKTDPFRNGVDLFVGRTDSDLCPVAAVCSYLERRGFGPGPLFRFQDGRFLTRERFVGLLRDGLCRAGIDDKKYCSHSFRIGAATTAAARGMEDSVIKTLGRWESLAYLQYVKIPRAELARYTCLLAH